MNALLQKSLNKHLDFFFEEDDLLKNSHYLNSLPDDLVTCHLKIKDDLVLSGLPFFFETFNYLSSSPIGFSDIKAYEGKAFKKVDKNEINFELPFSIALTGERIALNLLQRSSSISTFATKFVEKAKKYNIEILDTRKTTPGLRFLEKYATQMGGAKNHRFGQMDVWMIKDNHKNIFGGLKGAVDYFKSMNTFYRPIICEIHSMEELKVAQDLGIKYLMLDNFTPEKINEAMTFKKENTTYEVSGGINLKNIEDYLIEGVDAISIGALTYNAPHVDISLKYYKN